MTTAEGIRALAARLLTDELVVLPVRHHSPACAGQVARAIRERRPSAVLVEGPRTFGPLVPLLAHRDAVMPLAVYTWVADGPDRERAAGYYPFCDYSPELVAIREATAAGVPVRFIDLDLVEQERTSSGPLPEALTREVHYRHSEGLQLLAERLGCRDHEDLWERLFETAEVPLGEHVAQVAAYCRLARDDHPDDVLVADGTLAREAEMAHHVATALAARGPGDGPVLVVLGGFHAVVLPDLLAAPPPRPDVVGTVPPASTALIRYTFERLERLNGYAAGMTAPAWYQLLWEHHTGRAAGDEHPRVAATLSALQEIVGELRSRHRMPVPQPSVAAAFGHAVQLARLREREAPVRWDLLDAITSCLVQGDADVEGRIVHTTAARVLTGHRVGAVPPGAGMPPLVADTLARLRGQRLRVDDDERQLAALDLYRRAGHRATSRLLHGLALLGVPFAVRVAGPDFLAGTGLGRLQERWDYQWTPATEGVLAETSVLGSTLPEAVAARFDDLLTAQEEAAEGRSAEAAVRLLAQACLLGLHGRTGRVTGLVREGIGTDASFEAVADAVGILALLAEAREPLEARHLDELPELVRLAYARAIYLGRELRDGEAEPRAVARALARLRELLVSDVGADLDSDLYWAMVERLRTDHDGALVRGAAAGLLHVAGRLDAADLGGAVTGHLDGTVGASEAVAFVTGLMLTAREAAWQGSALLDGLDERLRAWDDATFVRHLPDLRLAFASLTPLETDRVAAAVAGRHGLGTLATPARRDVDADDVQALLAVAGEVAVLLERDGLSAWREAP
ncbi:hypothetical protein F9L07_17840 [Pimelobacter simplex]|uniref:Uncharacterized protein n=1 Tax=Nocardioides simplex TaxID=2045 RepID=A0A7J5DUC7_NOCSI|nr:DUF5682 family protein [Pimelobacter simplex]KAB2808934.1 hypothetical protein F9L07_17840 [Pimelobacter simplex]